MKRALLSFLLCSLLLTSFTSDSITLKKDKVEQIKVVLNSIYQYVEKSNLPHQDVIQMEQGIKIAFDNLGDTVGPKPIDSTATKVKPKK